ncbi:hypothetical protein BLNAU_8208 [Blattamonas nauphoetae]|uniref:Uncharacterized protein n=1 Tax=Blattamonas nauphoetae TaxID=2049346 RepID=A0ABQ9XZ53_9EUKA|nr:hypothetical protein BLNAU_8208 [Blattamonas nauphoetae]
MSNTNLIHGTGPLFDFSSDITTGANYHQAVTTTLSTSTITNTTSSPPAQRDERFRRSKLTQRILSSAVRKSTNHLSGTTINDMNSGGSLLSLNSSFTACRTTRFSSSNADAKTSQHFTQSTILASTSDKFEFTLCTFKECEATAGGAIKSYSCTSHLEIDQCSFIVCKSQGSYGGAVYVYHAQANTTYYTTITNSFFSSCSASTGGGVNFYRGNQPTITNCIFIDCSAIQYGGGLYFYISNFGSASGLTYCLLKNCKQTGTDPSAGGGGLRFITCTSVNIKYTQFRSCNSILSRGHDIYTDNSINPVNAEAFTGCDSDVNANQIRHNTVDLAQVMPKPSSEKTTALNALSVTQTSETKATLTLTLSTSVSGRMLVVVDNTGGTPRTDPTKAPQIGRLLEFQFTGSNSVVNQGQSVSETGLLQVPLTDYKITAACLPQYTTTIPTNLKITDPELTYLTHIPTPEFDEGTLKSNLTITFRGVNLTGTFIVTLQQDNIENVFNHSLEFTESKATLQAVGYDQTPSNVNLTFGSTYKVTDFKDAAGVSVPFWTDLAFTVPEKPERLLTLKGDGKYTDEEEKTFTTITFTKEHLLPNTIYTLTFTSEGQTHTKTISIETNANGDLGKYHAILFPVQAEGTTERNAQFEYSTTYRLTQMMNGDREVVRQYPDQMSFTTPAEQQRLTGLTLKGMVDNATKAEFEAEGRLMKEGTYELTMKETDSVEQALINVTFTSDTEGSGSAILFSMKSDEIQLKYGTNYTLVSVKSSSPNDTLVADGITFVTPPEPTRLRSLSIAYDADMKNVFFKMTGQQLDQNAKYEVDMSCTGLPTATVTFSYDKPNYEWKGSASLFPTESAKMAYGKTYNVAEFRKQGNSTPLFYISINIEIKPEPARFILAESILQKGGNSSILTISSQALNPTTTYKMTIDQGGTTVHTDSGTGAVWSPSFNIQFNMYSADPPNLLYGTQYFITFEDTDNQIEVLTETEAGSFRTPNEPERIMSVARSPDFIDEDKTSINLFFDSRQLLPNTDYTLIFASKKEGSPTHYKTIIVKTNSDSEIITHKAILYPTALEEEERKAQFEFDTEYSLDLAKRGSEEILYDLEQRTFLTPEEPTRLTELVLTGTTDKDKKVQFSAKGVVMSSGEHTIVVKEKQTDEEATFKMQFDDQNKGTGEAVLFSQTSSEIELQYDTEYTLVGVKDPSGTDIKFQRDIIFITSVEPTRIVTITATFDDDLTEATFVMTGILLNKSDQYSVHLTPATSQNAKIRLSYTSDQTWEGKNTLYPVSQLNYNTKYEVSAVIAVKEDIPVFFETTTTTFTTPEEPIRIEGTDCLLGGEKEKSGVVRFWGVGLSSGKGYTLKVQEEDPLGVVSGEVIELKGTLSSESESGSFLHFEEIFGVSSPRLSYGETYFVVGISVDGEDGKVVKDVNFTVPPEPSRLSKMTASGFTDEKKTTIELSSETHALSASTPYEMILQSIAGEGETVHEKKIVVTTNTDRVFPTFMVILYPIEKDETKRKGQLEFGTRYEVQKIQKGSTEIHFEATATTFATPNEPARLVSTSIKFHDGLNGSTLTIETRALTIDTDYTLTLTPSSDPTNTVAIDFRGKASTTYNFDLTFYPSRPDNLLYGKRYSATMAEKPSQEPIIVEEAQCSFDTPAEPERLVSVNGSEDFEDAEKSSSDSWNPDVTTACSEVIPVGSVGSVQHSSSYSMTSVTLATDDGVNAFCNKSAVLEIADKPPFLYVFVKTGGSDDGGECGEENLACSTVLVGQEAGWMIEDKTLRISVMGSVEMGGTFPLIGEERTLILTSATESLAMVKVRGEEFGEMKGVVEIEQGSLKVEHLLLSLPATVQSEEDETVYTFTVDKQGTLEMTDSKIANNGQNIGMSLARLVNGRIVLHTTEVSGMTFGRGISFIQAHSKTKPISLKMEECVMMGTTSQDAPLVSFVSEDEESSFEMTACRMSRTIRTDSSDSSSTAGLIEVQTAQHQLNIVGCVFEKSGVGTLSTITQSALSLSITPPSHPSSSRTVLISSCLFLDSTPPSPTTSALHITTHSEHTVIKIEDSWFETTTASRPWTLYSSGIATLDKNRVVGRAADTSTGALVTFSKGLPIVVRRRVTFANCNLKVIEQD